MSEFAKGVIGDQQRETVVEAHDPEDMDPKMIDGLARAVVMAMRGGARTVGDSMTLIMPEFEFGNDPEKLIDSGQWEIRLKKVG